MEYEPTPRVLALMGELRTLEERLDSLRTQSAVGMWASFLAPLFALASLFYPHSRTLDFLVIACIVFALGLGMRARRRLMPTVIEANRIANELLALVPRSEVGRIYLAIRAPRRSRIRDFLLRVRKAIERK